MHKEKHGGSCGRIFASCETAQAVIGMDGYGGYGGYDGYTR
jgi:hypothetical protein